MTKKSIVLYLSIIGLLLLGAVGWYAYSFRFDYTQRELSQPTTAPASFDAQRAYADVQTQVAFGSRVSGTEGHAKIRTWMREQLEGAGWQVETQDSKPLGHSIQNLIAKKSDAPPQIILGAHFDTRIFSDEDPNPAQQMNYVPGANDGASGVAVLLELARSLPEDTVPLWLVFFDAEDNWNIEGWDGELGSRAFVESLTARPQAVVIVDMIGDADLNIYKEHNSNAEITDQIWGIAKSLGYENKFIPEYKYSMIDDHTPFLQAGIPAVDIIDFDYPYWHTVQDTADKVSAESLQAVGETLRAWVMQQSRQP